jgi:hypothetical protein
MGRGWIAGLCLLAAPMAMASDVRDVSEAERASLMTMLRQKSPTVIPRPVFAAARSGAGVPWEVTAIVDTAPQRGLRQLCRLQRQSFRLAGQWQADGAPRAYAWLERPGCSATGRAVEMLEPMPDQELIGLLEHQVPLLQSARILLGGNSRCASQRSFNFSLSAVDVGSAGASPELLAGLVFTSDHGTRATVWARRSGADYTAWNVSCP